MSDRQRGEPDTGQPEGPWPPPPTQGEAGETPPPASSETLLNLSQVFKGFGMGIGVGAGLSLVSAMLSGVAYVFLSDSRYAALIFALPLVPEFFIARWLWRNQKTLGWTFGIVSITLSVLIGIALVQLVIAATPAPGVE